MNCIVACKRESDTTNFDPSNQLQPSATVSTRRKSNTYRRRDATKQLCRVASGGENYAYMYVLRIDWQTIQNKSVNQRCSFFI